MNADLAETSESLILPVCSLELRIFIEISNIYVEQMEPSDVDDVFEIIKMFLSSHCHGIDGGDDGDGGNIQAQLAGDWLEALDAGSALRKKMISVVAAEAGMQNK